MSTNLPLDYSDFIAKVEDSLRANDANYVLSLFKDNQNFDNVKNNCWDLVPIITKYLSSEYENCNEDLFKVCEQLIDKVAENSNPQEALLQFIEEIEEAQDDTKFEALLFPLLKVLQRIPKNRLNSLAWSLNSIQTYLNKIGISKGHETSLLCENETFHIEMLYHAVLNFYDVLIPYYYETIKKNKEFGLVVSKYLIELLGTPLGHLDLTLDKSKSKLRKHAENLVKKILYICEDPFFYLDGGLGNFLSPSDFSYGIFLYLILSEKIESESIPKVYNSGYIFYSSLKYIVGNLSIDRQFVTEKGLDTLETILQSDIKLSYLVLELEVNKTFCSILETIIVFNEYEKYRKQALRILLLYLNSFEGRGQYLLLYNLVPQIKHSGLAGFIITQYKEILVKFQRIKDVDLPYFEGKKLYAFLNRCCDIPIKGDYDLLNKGDKIISVLNLMRFLVLQENSESLEFKQISDSWRTKYLDPLQVLLHDAKSIFVEEKLKIKLGTSKPDREMDLSVDGKNILEMPENEKERSIDLSITAFEVMESLLNRLFELLESKNF